MIVFLAKAGILMVACFLSWWGKLDNFLQNQLSASRPHVSASRHAAQRMFTQQAAESLEFRELLTAVDLTAREQLLLELINRARANPTAEANRYGIDLNQNLSPGTISPDPKQPLAPNQILLNVARAHSDDMLLYDYFSHTGRDGSSPGNRITNAGYFSNTYGENISWGGSTGPIDEDAHVYERHRRLFLSAGHRENILENNFCELGAVISYGLFTNTDGRTYNASMVTEDFAAFYNSNFFLTGVVFTDASNGSASDDNFYTIGEAAGGGTVTAVNLTTNTVYTNDIGTAGGYVLQLPNGTYRVTVTGGALGSAEYVVDQVVVNSRNIKVDFETTTATPVTPGGNSYTTSFTGFVNGNLWVSQFEQGSWQTSRWTQWSSTQIVQMVQGDFNGDGIQDIAGWTPTGEWRVGLSNGQNQFTDQLWTTWRTTGIKEIKVGDFNNDGLDDIIGFFEANGRGSWWVAQSTGTQFVSRQYGVFHDYNDVVTTMTGDFDNNGTTDLAVQTQNGSWWIAKAIQGSFTYQKFSQWNVSNGIDHFQVGDFNADGRLDVAGLIGSGAQRQWWVGLSNGIRFINRNWSTWTVNGTLDSVVAGDFDGDGATDLAGLFNGQHWWVSRSVRNRFETSKWDQWGFALNGLRQVSVADIDQDGKDDLVGWDQQGWWNWGRSVGSQFNTSRTIQWAPNGNWTAALVGDFVQNGVTNNEILSADVFANEALLDYLNRISPEGLN
ncbi:MAG: VCBS repeat-containing protein [Planctomycetaceae bacterium]|nr:VCBS repeat-containing protein [Planctomycetaceae bacterium]